MLPLPLPLPLSVHPPPFLTHPLQLSELGEVAIRSLNLITIVSMLISMEVLDEEYFASQSAQFLLDRTMYA